MRCLAPLTIKSKNLREQLRFGQSREVNCGKCPACIDAKRREWVFRLKCEARYSLNAFFVTLTYNDDCLPKNEYGFPTFSKRDVQLFMKSFRESVRQLDSEIRVRHFIIGEYGSENGRPHYHGIIFNCPDLNTTLRLITEHWKHGFVRISECSDRRIGYCANYMYGKSDMPKYPLSASNVFRTLVSTKPGIGYALSLDDEFINYVKCHLDTPTFRIDGYSYMIPRYMLDKILTDKEKIQISVSKRLYVLQKQEEEDVIDENYYKKHGRFLSTQLKERYVEKYHQRKKHHKDNQLTVRDK